MVILDLLEPDKGLPGELLAAHDRTSRRISASSCAGSGNGACAPDLVGVFMRLIRSSPLRPQPLQTVAGVFFPGSAGSVTACAVEMVVIEGGPGPVGQFRKLSFAPKGGF